MSPHGSAGRRPARAISRWFSGACCRSSPMSKFLRLAAGVLCVGVLALGAVHFDPACLINFPHGWDPDNRASLAEEVARNEQLDQREAAIRRRREAKRQVAEEVIAGRRGLAEAIE